MARNFCANCGLQLPNDAMPCPRCGYYGGQSAPQPAVYYTQPQPKKSSSSTAVVVVILLLLFIFIVRPIMTGYNRAKQQDDANKDSLSETDYKAACVEVTYEDMARDNNGMENKTVTISGEIVQEMEDYYYRMETSDGNDIAIFYRGAENFIEGDKLTVWGMSEGFTEWKNLLGKKVKTPTITVVYYERS